MSLVLELPTDLETALAAEAAEFGLPLPEYILRILDDDRRPKPSPRNGAELLAYWRVEGLVGTRSDIADTATHPRSLREKSQRRVRT